MKENTVKKMKVYKGYHHRSYQPHPLIRLKGLHLAKLGFKIGDSIYIEMSQGHIHIRSKSER